MWCMARLTAEGCRRYGTAEALKLCLSLRCLPLTDIPKPQRIQQSLAVEANNALHTGAKSAIFNCLVCIFCWLFLLHLLISVLLFFYTPCKTTNFYQQDRPQIRIVSVYSVSMLSDVVFSERELTFTFAICYRPSVCRLSVVCNVRALYSGSWNFRQYFYGIRYIGHPLTSPENFTEIVPGEALRRGS